MDTQEALELFTQLIEEKFNHKISEVQRIFFKGFWDRVSYNEIRDTYNLVYDKVYIRDLGRQLNNLAEKLCGCKKINKTNFRTIIEPYLKEQQKSSNQTKTTLSLDFADLIFGVLDKAENRNWYNSQDYRNFAALTQEIANLIKNDEKHQHYQIIARCWKLIKNFTHVYDPYWTQRQEILHWLLAGAKKKGDKPMLAESFSELGLTLTLLHPHEKEAQSKAEFYLREALQLANSQEPISRIDLYINIAILNLAKGEINHATNNLVTAKHFLAGQWPESKLRNRCLSNLHYYLGECEFWSEKWKEADQNYQSATEYSQLIGWQRGEVAAKNWQAEIAIQNSNLETAERLLTNGLKIVRQYEDHRSAGFHCRSLVWLNEKKGDQNQVCYYANQAVNEFLFSNMPVEAEEMKKIRDNRN